MANHNDGIGLEHAANRIMGIVRYAAKTHPEWFGWGTLEELVKVCEGMRKRVKIEKERAKDGR